MRITHMAAQDVSRNDPPRGHQATDVIGIPPLWERQVGPQALHGASGVVVPEQGGPAADVPVGARDLLCLTPR